jgi:hypothetical protein
MWTESSTPASSSKTGGNRCGHDPKRPLLTPANPIRKGKGGLPRILSLAAELTKAWYDHPKTCPVSVTTEIIAEAISAFRPSLAEAMIEEFKEDVATYSRI